MKLLNGFAFKELSHRDDTTNELNLVDFLLPSKSAHPEVALGEVVSNACDMLYTSHLRLLGGLFLDHGLFAPETTSSRGIARDDLALLSALITELLHRDTRTLS